MSDPPKSFHLSPEVHDYLVAHGNPPDELQRALIEETRALGGVSVMQIAPEQGAFMTWLARTLGVRRAVEVGTFTGYSALALARGMPDDGHLLCCDVSEEWTAIARRYWEKAGVAHKIDLQIGPAAETLAAQPEREVLDLGFIDADKPNYPVYYEAILNRLRPGGVIVVDNVLWSGRVADPSANDENTNAIRAFNTKLTGDARVECVMLPVSDGLTLVRKK